MRRWFEFRIQPVRGMCVHSVDIHERKVKELTLARREAELEARTVFDAIRRAFLGR